MKSADDLKSQMEVDQQNGKQQNAQAKPYRSVFLTNKNQYRRLGYEALIKLKQKDLIELEILVAQNDANALFDIASLYRFGHLVAINNELAFQYLKKSAELGLPIAHWELAFWYKRQARMQKPGMNVSYRNCMESMFVHFKKAAEAGFAKAQFDLAYHYEKVGYRQYSPLEERVDYIARSLAYKWYDKAAELGLPEALHAKASCIKHNYGVLEIDADVRKAKVENCLALAIKAEEVYAIENPASKEDQDLSILHLTPTRKASQAKPAFAPKIALGFKDMQDPKLAIEPKVALKEPKAESKIDKDKPYRSVYLTENGQYKDDGNANLKKLDEGDLEIIYKHAKNRDPQACFEMAMLYRAGHILPHNKNETVEYLTEASNLGLAIADWELSYYFRHPTGAMKKRDNKERVAVAHEHLKKAADAGFAKAKHDLALFYETKSYNRILPFVLEDSSKTCFDLYEGAAKLGLRESQCALALCYLQDYGVSGLDKAANIKAAQYWFEEARKNGYNAPIMKTLEDHFNYISSLNGSSSSNSNSNSNSNGSASSNNSTMPKPLFEGMEPIKLSKTNPMRQARLIAGYEGMHDTTESVEEMEDDYGATTPKKAKPFVPSAFLPNHRYKLRNTPRKPKVKKAAPTLRTPKPKKPPQSLKSHPNPELQLQLHSQYKFTSPFHLGVGMNADSNAANANSNPPAPIPHPMEMDRPAIAVKASSNFVPGTSQALFAEAEESYQAIKKEQSELPACANLLEKSQFLFETVMRTIHKQSEQDESQPKLNAKKTELKTMREAMVAKGIMDVGQSEPMDLPQEDALVQFNGSLRSVVRLQESGSDATLSKTSAEASNDQGQLLAALKKTFNAMQNKVAFAQQEVSFERQRVSNLRDLCESANEVMQDQQVLLFSPLALSENESRKRPLPLSLNNVGDEDHASKKQKIDNSK